MIPNPPPRRLCFWLCPFVGWFVCRTTQKLLNGFWTRMEDQVNRMEPFLFGFIQHWDSAFFAIFIHFSMNNAWILDLVWIQIEIWVWICFIWYWFRLEWMKGDCWRYAFYWVPFKFKNIMIIVNSDRKKRKCVIMVFTGWRCEKSLTSVAQAL